MFLLHVVRVSLFHRKESVYCLFTVYTLSWGERRLEFYRDNTGHVG